MREEGLGAPAGPAQGLVTWTALKAVLRLLVRLWFGVDSEADRRPLRCVYPC